jgi:FMN-dependent oxidoreductase (nitrilotriacetate monooxygenase family)
MSSKKPLIFTAFDMLTPSHHDHGQWVREDSGRLRHTEAAYWVGLAQTLERARFDILFFADVMAPAETFGGSRDAALRAGIQAPAGDAASILSLLGYATENLSFAFTENILQEHPYSFARRISTLDHLLEGRLGWNIVTSSIPGTGRNLGYGGLPEHEIRYERAEEFLEVVYKLWEQSWDEDAVVRDRKTATYVEPSRVHDINHKGRFYEVPGAHASEPSPQRTPLLFSAGTSDRWTHFAAKNAEGAFTFIPPGDPLGKVAEIRRATAAAGRDPHDIKILCPFSFVLGSTEEEAKKNADELNETRSTESLLVKLSESVKADLAVIPLDEKLSSILTREQPGEFGTLSDRLKRAPDIDWSFERFVQWQGANLHTVGTPEQLADAIENWRDIGVDGLIVQYANQPSGWEDWAEFLTPELTARGLMRSEYGTGTLRERVFGKGARLPEQHPARRLPISPASPGR